MAEVRLREFRLDDAPAVHRWFNDRRVTSSLESLDGRTGEADASGQAMSYLSATVIQEQLLYLYNQGSPTGDPALIGEGPRPQVPLVPLYPVDGTIMLDHPYVVLPSASDAQRAGAEDFLSYLRQPTQQQRLAGHGFRDHTGAAGAELTDAVAIPDGTRL
jgi:Ca-activated chloride channel homolog